MKRTLILLLASTIVTTLCVPEALAGVTCTVVPAMCPPPPNGGKNPVPEPGTLALLAAGAGAVAAGLRIRRKKP